MRTVFSVGYEHSLSFLSFLTFRHNNYFYYRHQAQNLVGGPNRLPRPRKDKKQRQPRQNETGILPISLLPTRPQYVTRT